LLKKLSFDSHSNFPSSPPSIDQAQQLETDGIQADKTMGNVHFVDQAIHDIAKEFRFTVEEVQEYYDRCGEMGRTKMRFQRMRQELSAHFADDDGDGAK
jgi:hypothetical protein